MAIREISAGHEALGLDEDDLRRMHYHMLLARRVDERSWILNRQGKAAFVISSAPVGVQYPQAAGTALAFKMRGEDGVVLVSGGEASTSGGDWHEAMNFAGIHDLPVVFLVENNVYAISVPTEFQVAGSIT